MSDRKKLMIFSHVCNAKNMTGAEKLLLFLARKLNVYFECVLVVPLEGKLAQMARASGIRTKQLYNPLLYEMCAPFEGLQAKADLLAYSFDGKAILSFLQEENCDFVFVNTCVNVVPAMMAKHLGIPVIWHITETVPEQAFRHLTVSMVQKYSDYIVGISEAVLSPYRLGTAPSKVSLLYPSWEQYEYHPERWDTARMSKRKEWGIKEGQTVIGYVSSFLIAQKGPEHFVEAAIELNKKFKQLKFVVIGGELDRHFYRQLKRKIREAECTSKFIFSDYEDAIETAYCAMDIVVVPSLLSEGFGMTAMEAMIVGKPVVSYAAGGLREILESAGSGEYLVGVGDKKQLQAKISSLVEAPNMAKQIGITNQEKVNLVFGPQNYDHQLHSLVATISDLKGVVIPLNQEKIDNIGMQISPAMSAAPEASNSVTRQRSSPRRGHPKKSKVSHKRIRKKGTKVKRNTKKNLTRRSNRRPKKVNHGTKRIKKGKPKNRSKKRKR
jgi:glycosyltransferase involved in cell wall biosynthesis